MHVKYFIREELISFQLQDEMEVLNEIRNMQNETKAGSSSSE